MCPFLLFQMLPQDSLNMINNAATTRMLLPRRIEKWNIAYKISLTHIQPKQGPNERWESTLPSNWNLSMENGVKPSLVKISNPFSISKKITYKLSMKHLRS
jgi:hypothetical protein